MISSNRWARLIVLCYLHQHSQIGSSCLGSFAKHQLTAAQASYCRNDQLSQINCACLSTLAKHKHSTPKASSCRQGRANPHVANGQKAQQHQTASSELLLASVSCQEQPTCSDDRPALCNVDAPLPPSEPPSPAIALPALKRGRKQRIGVHGNVMAGNAWCSNNSQHSLASNREGNGDTFKYTRCSQDTESSQFLGPSPSVLSMLDQGGKVLSLDYSVLSQSNGNEAVAFVSTSNGKDDGALASTANGPSAIAQSLISPVQSLRNGRGFEWHRKVKLVEQLSPNSTSTLLKKRDFRHCSFEQLEAVIEVLRNYLVCDERVLKVLAKNNRLLSHPIGLLQQKLKLLTFFQIEKETVDKISTSRRLFSVSIETLQERLLLFEEIGLSKKDRNRALCRATYLLNLSKEKLLKTLDFLISIGGTRETLLLLWKYQPNVLSRSVDEDLIPRYNYLQQFGISAQKIPLVLAISSRNSIDSMKAKLQNLKGLGFFEDNVPSLVEKQPSLVGRGSETLKKILDFLVHEMERNIDDIIKYPACLQMSLERRIAPRCRLAREHGLFKVYSFSTILKYSDSSFEKLCLKCSSTVEGDSSCRSGIKKLVPMEMSM